MWSYKKEIEKIKAMNLPDHVNIAIIAVLEHKLPESSICPLLNQFLAFKDITQKQAYEIMDILGLIDEECLEDQFILDEYDHLED